MSDKGYSTAKLGGKLGGADAAAALSRFHAANAAMCRLGEYRLTALMVGATEAEIDAIDAVFVGGDGAGRLLGLARRIQMPEPDARLQASLWSTTAGQIAAIHIETGYDWDSQSLEAKHADEARLADRLLRVVVAYLHAESLGPWLPDVVAANLRAPAARILGAKALRGR